MPAITRSTGAASDHPTPLFNTTLFDILAALGVFSVVAVLGPAIFSSRVKRPMIWFGLLTSWLLYSVSYLLLLGRQSGPANPPFGLCILQASLIYATTPLCAVATTCFSIDFFLKLWIVQIQGRVVSRKIANTLVFFPWIIGFAIVGETVLCVQSLSTARRDVNHFYCHINNPLPTLTNVAVIFICGMITTPLGICTAIYLRRNWIVFKRLNKNHAQIALSTFLRMTLFTMIVSFAMAVSIFTATKTGDYKPAVNLALTTLPIFSALCLGTQRDIVEVWLFWKNKRPTTPISIQSPKTIKAPNIDIKIPSPMLGTWKSDNVA